MTEPEAEAEAEDDLDTLNDVEVEEDEPAKTVVVCPLTAAARAASKMYDFILFFDQNPITGYLLDRSEYGR